MRINFHRISHRNTCFWNKDNYSLYDVESMYSRYFLNLEWNMKHVIFSVQWTITRTAYEEKNDKEVDFQKQMQKNFVQKKRDAKTKRKFGIGMNCYYTILSKHRRPTSYIFIPPSHTNTYKNVEDVGHKIRNSLSKKFNSKLKSRH